jgi:hypothetical protein
VEAGLPEIDIHAVRADDLRFLVALANTGRLVAAATSLGVDHSTVSRRILSCTVTGLPEMSGRLHSTVCVPIVRIVVPTSTALRSSEGETGASSGGDLTPAPPVSNCRDTLSFVQCLFPRRSPRDIFPETTSEYGSRDVTLGA